MTKDTIVNMCNCYEGLKMSNSYILRAQLQGTQKNILYESRLRKV